MNVIISSNKRKSTPIHLHGIVVLGKTMQEYVDYGQNVLMISRRTDVTPELQKCALFTDIIAFFGHVMHTRRIHIAFYTTNANRDLTCSFLPLFWRSQMMLGTGACNAQTGSVVLQKQPDNVSKLVSYWSRFLINAEKKYDMTERVCLAIHVVWPVSLLRLYLGIQQLSICTDQDILKWLIDLRDFFLQKDLHTGNYTFPNLPSKLYTVKMLKPKQQTLRSRFPRQTKVKVPLKIACHY